MTFLNHNVVMHSTYYCPIACTPRKFGFSRVTKAESRGLSGHIVEPDPDR